MQAVEGRSSFPPSMQTAEAVLALMGICSMEDQGAVVMEAEHWWQPDFVTSETEQALRLLTRGLSSTLKPLALIHAQLDAKRLP